MICAAFFAAFYHAPMPPKGWTETRRFRGHAHGIFGFAWSPDGRRIATAAGDGGLVVWRPDRAVPELSVGLHMAISDVAWSPDGSTIAVVVEHEAADPFAEDEQKEPALVLAQAEEDAALREFERAHDLTTASRLPFVDHGPPTVRLLDAESGMLVGALAVGRGRQPTGIGWLGDGKRLVAATLAGVELWHAPDGHFLGCLEGSEETPFGDLACSPDGSLIAACHPGGGTHVWDAASGHLRFILRDPSSNDDVFLSFDWESRQIAVGSDNGLVKVWTLTGDDADLRLLEGHADLVTGLSFLKGARILATRAHNGEVKLWTTTDWQLLSEWTVRSHRGMYGWIACAPNGPQIALGAVGDSTLVLHEVDPAALTAVADRPDTVHYANAKVVLLGDSGVGKSGLGLVLAGERYRETDSTHKRNVYQLATSFSKDEPSERRETFLWDLAGQPGYRLLHQLHLADVAVALVVFDAKSELAPLAGVRYWARALRQAERQAIETGTAPIRRIVVAARMDRGGARVSDDELRQVREQFGFDDYITTSAKQGEGIATLRERIDQLLDWDALPKVSSTTLFDAIRGFLLSKRNSETLLIQERELREAFVSTGADVPDAIEEEFRACVGRAESRGLVRRLSFGDFVLLRPEVLDAYAAAVVNAAREEPQRLGAIRERDVLEAGFPIPHDVRIADESTERLLLIATVEDLLRYEVALREDSGQGSVLVFPTESRTEITLGDGLEPWCDIAFEGAIRHVWATLVVRLSHSGAFVVEEAGANVAIFGGDGRRLAVECRDVEEGSAGLRLFSDGDFSSTERLFEQFVTAHLERRAVNGSVVRTAVVGCPACGFLMPDELVRVVAERGLRELRCPLCTEPTALEGGPRSIPETTKLRALDAAANEERGRLTRRISVQGKTAVSEFDVFLAHNSEDKDAVKQIGERLRDVGLNPWLDAEQIAPGSWFQAVIQETIRQVRSAAIFIGPSGLGRWEEIELRAFVTRCVEAGVTVIPVLLPGARWPLEQLWLGELQRVVFRETIEDDEGFRDLVWGITGERDWLDQRE